jgi:chromatin remodeling complex protein RSC6
VTQPANDSSSANKKQFKPVCSKIAIPSVVVLFENKQNKLKNFPKIVCLNLSEAFFQILSLKLKIYNLSDVKFCQFMSFYVKLCQKMYQPEANSDLKSKKQPKTSSKEYALTTKKNQVTFVLRKLN